MRGSASSSASVARLRSSRFGEGDGADAGKERGREAEEEERRDACPIGGFSGTPAVLPTDAVLTQTPPR